jgi:hypothetical protein
LVLLAALGACGKSSSIATDGGHPADAGNPTEHTLILVDRFRAAAANEAWSLI